MTKVGHDSGSQMPDVDGKTTVEVGENSVYSLDPDFVEAEISKSAEKLGTVPDCVLLHNPEWLLSSFRQEGMTRQIAHDMFHEAVQNVFIRMEQLVAQGLIGNSYGISSNIYGCQWSVSGAKNTYEAPSFPRVIDDAKQAAATVSAKDHSMRVLQVPINCLELGAVLAYQDPTHVKQAGKDTPVIPSPLRIAKQEGVGVVVNRPLHAIPPLGLNTSDWSQNAGGLQDKQAENFFKLCDTTPQSPLLALIKNIIKEKADFADCLDSLQQLALWLMASTKGVDTVLCGARSPAYVEDLVVASKVARLDEQEVWNTFDYLQDTIDEMLPKK